MNSSIYLLHGWGCDSSSWQPLVPLLENHFKVIAIDLPGFGTAEPLDNFDLNSVVDYLANQIQDNSLVMGWSLGGNIALQLAARYPQKISGLISLASNLKFVADDSYPCAMSPIINKNFNQSFSENPIAALKLFGGLVAQGDQNERALLKQMRQQIFKKGSESFESNDSDPFLNPNWMQALELLSQIDNRSDYASLKIPGLHLLAEKDALVPVACEFEFKRLNPSQSVAVINGAAHALHWSQPELVAQKIIEFVDKIQRGQSLDSNPFVLLNKRRIANSFGRAAATYNQAADLQRKVGENLLRQFEFNSSVERVLDLGCGTGFFLPSLKTKFPRAQVMGADIAEPMLRENNWSQSKILEDKFYSDSNYYLVCADAEALPFAGQSFDRIYSNFSLQWCFNLPELFAELKRTIKPNGEVVFTTLGASSLHELKSAWQQVDDQVHVNRFFSIGQWRESAEKFFSQVELRAEIEVCYFSDFRSLAKSLKMLGAHNLNEGRPRGLTGRKKMEALENAYEKFRTAQGLPLSYEVIYGRVKQNV